MGRAYQQQQARARQEAQTETVVVYTNPMTSSGYDPDGIQSLLNEDEIDWDGFDWDSWSWVTLPNLEGTPSWEDLDYDEKRDWFDDNKDRFDPRDHGVTGPSFDAMGTVYEADRASGAEGGTEINYDYYQKDPWYNLAFNNLGIEIGEEGLTQENLQEATKYLVETFRSVMNDGYRDPWDAEMPETWEPKEMTTDYETPFDIPAIVPRQASPSMPGSMVNPGGLLGRADANAVWRYNRDIGNVPHDGQGNLLKSAPGFMAERFLIETGKLPYREGVYSSPAPYKGIPEPQSGFKGEGIPEQFKPKETETSD